MPRTPIPARCRRWSCGVLLVVQGAPVPAGHRPHGGRGLCQPCYEWARHWGNLDEFPPLLRPPAVLLERWRELSARGLDEPAAAAALGVSRKHLRRVLSGQGVPAAARPRRSRPGRSRLPYRSPPHDLCTLDEGESA